MYEELASWGVLLRAGLMSWEEYDAKLDERFDAQPEDEYLARLEWCGSNRKDALSILLSLLERRDLDLEALGGWVFGRLEEVYRGEDCHIQAFDRLIRAVWRDLPDGLRSDGAVFGICYADEILEYRGEDEARDVYEAAFRRFHPGAPSFARRGKGAKAREEPVRPGILGRLALWRKKR